VDILGGDVNDFSESELRSIYMSSLGAAAHASVEAAANALGVSTSDYFLAGGAAGVRGLSPQEIRNRARDMRRRGGLSAATAGGVELVTILGGDPESLSEDELRSLYMSSLGAAAHASVEAAANALGVSTSDCLAAGGAAGIRGLSAQEIRNRARDVRRRAGLSAHASVEAAANALGVSTKEFFLAGGSVGVHGLNANQIKAKARDVEGKPFSTDTAKAANLVGASKRAASVVSTPSLRLLFLQATRETPCRVQTDNKCLYMW
jgi:LmbE family N-acetylglucosaminyl deacetylase